jgi:hypothetical protein
VAELLSSRNTGWEYKVYFALVVIEPRDSPLAITIHAILVDLKPYAVCQTASQKFATKLTLETSHCSRQRVIHLG